LLRSIKELEFDRGMGKVSEKDFAEMSARLRTRAGRLMRQLDAASLYRQEIEREVARRLGAQEQAGAGGAANAARAVADSVDTPPRRLECPSCGIINDRDARFCKDCGARIEGSA
jgi:hypothetical protein